MTSQACAICEKGCILAEGRDGACGLYELRDGRIEEKYADHYLVVTPISIETMPILHYRPGAKYLQITTTGCNFNCPGCISTVLAREMDPGSRALKRRSAGEIVGTALEAGCEGIAFLMNDPLAAFPRFLRIAKLAREKGLKAGCSSNGYFTEEALAQLLPYLDFVNMGLKGLTDGAYRACGVPGVAPVLRNLAALHEAGVHVEISCILMRHNAGELRELARHLASLSPDIPLQVMRFIPIENADPAAEPSIREAEAFCRSLSGILHYVYLFNTPGAEMLDTHCPSCGAMALHREFYGPMGAKLQIPPAGLPDVGRCPGCGVTLPVTGPAAAEPFKEGDFQGGYPFTRALEMIEAMLIAMGVKRQETVVRAWEDLLQGDGLKKLHKLVQNPRTYLEAVRALGRKTGHAAQAEELAQSIAERLARVEKIMAGAAERPRVYYAMGKPLFYINGERMENQLVELAGGLSLNKQFPGGGRPGRNLTVDEFNALKPDFIFISGFLSNPVDDFYAECVELGLKGPAIEQRRIFNYPGPIWDFGSPRWILGLMFLASTLHPDRCDFDVMAEAQAFHQRFYGMDFEPRDVNRSFAKPSSAWSWENAAREEAVAD